MPTLSIYVNKELYNKILQADEKESKVVQKALMKYFKMWDVKK